MKTSKSVVLSLTYVFSGLSLCAKVDILHLVEEEIKEKFVQEEKVVIYQSSLPHGIDLVPSESGTHLVATKGFGIGETLFTNRAELVSMNELAKKQYVIDIGGRFYLVEVEHHVVFRDGFAEILGKDHPELMLFQTVILA